MTGPVPRAARPAARILLVDGRGRVLLFRFVVAGRPPFWVTPGGALDPGETYPQAARRELREEVGLDLDCGPEVARRVVDFLTVEDVEVTADERYFRVDVGACEVDSAGHTPLERRVMQQWRWFARDDLASHPEPVYPVDLPDLLHATEPKAMIDLTRVALSTGVELDVQVAGDPANPPVILLHGFPESHRTWRHQVPVLARDHFVLAPDQRGYARSSKPQGVEAYRVEAIVADLLALADRFGIGRFALAGHDWGGAVAWGAALANPDRVARLLIVNAPHPFLFQRALFDDPEQRAASQYITRFRDTGLDQGLVGAGLERFLGSTFARHLTRAIGGEDKAAYLDEWSQPGAMTAMLNWYRASGAIVPAPGEDPPRPAFLDRPFPPVTQPTLVVWGMADKALRPSINADLAAHVPDLTLVEVADAGHFVPWEKPEAVTDAMVDWLALTADRG